MTDEAKELFEDLTLYAVVAVFVILTAIGYMVGSTMEGILLRALIASATVGLIGWLLMRILANPGFQGTLRRDGAKGGGASGIQPSLKREDTAAAEAAIEEKEN